MYNDEESNEDNDNSTHNDNNNEVVVVDEKNWEEEEEGNNEEIAEVDSLEEPHEEEQEGDHQHSLATKPKTLQEFFALAGQTLQLVTSEDGTPIHDLGNDGKVVPISLDKSKEDERRETNEIEESKQIDKYEERRLEAKKELE
jgi:hypothetical protein